MPLPLPLAAVPLPTPPVVPRRRHASGCSLLEALAGGRYEGLKGGSSDGVSWVYGFHGFHGSNMDLYLKKSMDS